MAWWQRLLSDRTAVALGATAAVIYALGLGWGLPYATHAWAIHGWDVDAVTGVQTLSELHNLIRPQPDWWVAYPLFHYLVLGATYAPYLAFLVLTGGLSSPAAEFPFGLADPARSIATLALLGRVVTVCMASGVVVTTYAAGKTAWDKRTGVIAAVVVMLATPMLYYARTGNLDIPVLFWTSLGVWVLARIVTGGNEPRQWAWLGAAAALSVATKDQAYGGWIAVMVPLGLVYGLADRHSAPGRGARWWGPAWMVGAGSIVFALASGLVIRPGRFVAHLEFLTNFEQTFPNVRQVDMLRPATLAGYGLLLGDVLQALILALGPVLLLAGLVGLGVTFRTAGFTRVLFNMLLGHVVFVIFPIRHMQFRYSLLPALIIALWAARALSLGLAGGSWTRLLSLATFALGLGWIGARGVDLTYQMWFDARYAAGEWMSRQAQPGETVAFLGPTPNTLPPLPVGTTARQLPDDETALAILRREPVEFVLVVPGAFTDVGLNRIPLVPVSVQAQLQDGSLGYRAAAEFNTPALLPPVSSVPLNSMGYLVNPALIIYQRVD
jgi:hypothetical protein